MKCGCTAGDGEVNAESFLLVETDRELKGDVITGLSGDQGARLGCVTLWSQNMKGLT